MSGLRKQRVTGSIDACTDLLDLLQTQSLLELTVEATLFDDFGLHEPFAAAVQLKLAALGLDTLHAVRLHHENQFISVQSLGASAAVRFTLYLRLSQYDEAYALVTVFEACQAYLESVKKLACINLDLRVNATFWMAVFSLFPNVEELELMGFDALGTLQDEIKGHSGESSQPESDTQASATPAVLLPRLHKLKVCNTVVNDPSFDVWNDASVMILSILEAYLVARLRLNVGITTLVLMKCMITCRPPQNIEALRTSVPTVLWE